MLQGVLQRLLAAGVRPQRYAGSSAGAIVAVAAACAKDQCEIEEFAEQAIECRSLQALENLPDDAHEQASGRAVVCVTGTICTKQRTDHCLQSAQRVHPR